jgi:hypothetical protein
MTSVNYEEMSNAGLKSVYVMNPSGIIGLTDMGFAGAQITMPTMAPVTTGASLSMPTMSGFDFRPLLPISAIALPASSDLGGRREYSWWPVQMSSQ